MQWIEPSSGKALWRGLSVAGVLATAALLATPAWASAADPHQVVVEAIREAREIPEQARILAKMAWLEPGLDPAVAKQARDMLLGFGAHGMRALREALLQVAPEDQADVVRVLIEARNRYVTSGIPADFLPALETAVWFGTREARLLAIPELGRFRYRPAVVTLIDAAHEDPALIPAVVDALGHIGDDRARFFLERILLEGPDPVRASAASALASIGGRARFPLKSATLSERPQVRRPAVQALLATAGPDDLSVLYEYLARYSSDDPGLTQAVQATAHRLEEAMAERAEAERLSPGRPR